MPREGQGVKVKGGGKGWWHKVFWTDPEGRRKSKWTVVAEAPDGGKKRTEVADRGVRIFTFVQAVAEGLRKAEERGEEGSSGRRSVEG